MTTDGEHSPRYVMIGGARGAGKTTAVARLARILSDRGQRVGLITNDQSSGLVDTTILRSRGFAVEEISGGCFCCRFPSLQDAASRLTDETRPDIFLAEHRCIDASGQVVQLNSWVSAHPLLPGTGNANVVEIVQTGGKVISCGRRVGCRMPALGKKFVP